MRWKAVWAPTVNYGADFVRGDRSRSSTIGSFSIDTEDGFGLIVIANREAPSPILDGFKSHDT